MKKMLIWIMLLMAMFTVLAVPCFATEAEPASRVAVDLTPVFQAVIALLAALVTGRLIPWIKSKTTEQQQNNLMAIVRTLVYAAEQMYGAGTGDAKLWYVQKSLKEQGYDLDTMRLKNMIEAAVKEMSFEQGVIMTAGIADGIEIEETVEIQEAQEVGKRESGA